MINEFNQKGHPMVFSDEDTNSENLKGKCRSAIEALTRQHGLSERLSEACFMLALSELENNWKQRAEAAEATIRQQDELILSYQETIRQQTAKLAELEKQEPVACKKRLVNHLSGKEHSWTYHGEVDEASQGDVFRIEVVPLFERPAPAFRLAELVPGEMHWQEAPVEGSTRSAAYATGFNACRAAILRNIDAMTDACPKTGQHEWVHHVPCYREEYEECNKCGQRRSINKK